MRRLTIATAIIVAPIITSILMLSYCQKGTAVLSHEYYFHIGNKILEIHQ